MSEQARAARVAMNAKAKRLTEGKNEKVDSSDWNPSQTFDAEAKTGKRPINPRAFKRGGKVEGAAVKHHSGAKPRKAVGGPLGKFAPMPDDPRAGAAGMMGKAASIASVPQQMMNFTGGKKSPLLKRGGRAGGGSTGEANMGDYGSMSSNDGDGTSRAAKGTVGYNKVETQTPKYDGRTTPRSARKSGGRTGKTQINIVIGSKDKDQSPMMPPTGPVRPPVVPPPPPPPPGMPMGGPPMMPPGGPMPPMGGPPPGMPPMPRKRGGRTSYPIDDGAGGGQGRLEKAKAYGLTQKSK